MSIRGSELDVVILAAGKGVRMRSDLPKVLHRVCGQTILERTLRAVCGVSPSKVVVVVGYGRERVEAELDRLASCFWCKGIEIQAIEQVEQKGTGHAVQVAMPALRSDSKGVLIVPADSPLVTSEIFSNLVAGLDEQTVISLATCTPPNPKGFGRIVRNDKGVVEQIIEEKDCSEGERAIGETNASMYVVQRKFLDRSIHALDDNNAQQEFYVTDIVGFAAHSELGINAICVEDYSLVQGANSRVELVELERIRRSRIANIHLDAGVTIEDPASTYIDEDVRIGIDSFIGAGTHIKGNTGIGERVVIEGNAWIVNCQISSDTLIKFTCALEDAVVDSGCQIGPFARIRPGSHLHESVRIGNFVETKKAEIQYGAKVNHLTYIGDALIGAEANIGAGTITCNYDGKNKFKTVIGEKAFIGSNSCLVAPVTIGDGAYVGAGSTITKSVPDKSLGIGRAKQTNIDGWTKRFSKKDSD